MKEHQPNKVVKFVFSAYEKLSADLKIRLRYDNLSQTKFFAGIVKLYLENDEDMIRVIYKVKQNTQAMGKNKLNKSKNDIKKGNEIMKQLGITDTDKSSIFDMIELNRSEYE